MEDASRGRSFGVPCSRLRKTFELFLNVEREHVRVGNVSDMPTPRSFVKLQCGVSGVGMARD